MRRTFPSIETTSAWSLETFGFSNTISQIADSRPMRMPEPPRPRRSPARVPLRIVNLPRTAAVPPLVGGVIVSEVGAPASSFGGRPPAAAPRPAAAPGVRPPQRRRLERALGGGAEAQQIGRAGEKARRRRELRARLRPLPVARGVERGAVVAAQLRGDASGAFP